MDLEKRAKEIEDLDLLQEEIEKKKENIKVEIFEENKESNNDFDLQVKDNNFITELSNNSVAVDLAKKSYEELKNQKKISKGIERVVNKNTETDIESADIKVKEKQKNNAVKKAEIKNALLILRKEKIYIKKEQKHKLEMQRAKQIREKYEDLLLRTCRKKQKDDNGKTTFVNDDSGKPIINIPSKFRLFWLRLFDGLISTLNQTAEIFGMLNKNVLKGGFIIIVLLLIFVQPFRYWLLGLIGISL